jgi:hypothetical protein
MFIAKKGLKIPKGVIRIRKLRKKNKYRKLKTDYKNPPLLPPHPSLARCSLIYTDVSILRSIYR